MIMPKSGGKASGTGRVANGVMVSAASSNARPANNAPRRSVAPASQSLRPSLLSICYAFRQMQAST